MSQPCVLTGCPASPEEAGETLVPWSADPQTGWTGAAVGISLRPSDNPGQVAAAPARGHAGQMVCQQPVQTSGPLTPQSWSKEHSSVYKKKDFGWW